MKDRMNMFLSKWLYFCCVSISMATVVSCQSNQSKQLHLNQETNEAPVNNYSDGENINIDGLYYGVEEINGFKSAIIFRLNKKGGFLYQQPNFLQIFELEVKAPNLIKFKVGRDPDNIVQGFEGDFEFDYITGKFRSLSKDDENQKNDIRSNKSDSKADRKGDSNDKREQVRFQRLETLLSQSGCEGGLYSNRAFHKESGDMVGEELLLIPTSRNVFGVFRYDNGDVSYAFETRIQDNKFEFEITQGGFKSKFSGICSQNRIVISYAGESADIKIESQVLSKKWGLYDFLTKLPR